MVAPTLPLIRARRKERRAISAWRLNYLIRVRHEKEASTFGESRPKFASFGRMGDDPRPLMSDARESDCISIFREVTASTKRLSSQTAKPPARGCVRQAALPHPPYVPFSWTAIRWVVEPRVYSAAVFASVRPGEHSVGTVARKPLFRGYVPCQTQDS
jgi:hypothetical protein